MLRVKARLDRLEGALTPATPHVVPIRAIASNTGEIIYESELVFHDWHERRPRRMRAEPGPRERPGRR